MVIFAAVGGRMSLVGAVYGTLLVNFGKTYFSEAAPDVWLFLMAALFIGVVMAFPNGLAGLFEEKVKPWWLGRQAELALQKQRRRARDSDSGDGPPPALTAATPKHSAAVKGPGSLPGPITGQHA